MKFHGEVKNLLCSIARAKNSKTVKITHPYSKKIAPLLKVLCSEGVLIRYFIDLQNSRVTIFLTSKLLNFPQKPTFVKKNARLKNLNAINYKNPGLLCFLSTSEGIIEKKNKNIGGDFLCTLV